MIDHGNGFVTMYLHNSSLAVSVGDVVSGTDDCVCGIHRIFNRNTLPFLSIS